MVLNVMTDKGLLQFELPKDSNKMQIENTIYLELNGKQDFITIIDVANVQHILNKNKIIAINVNKKRKVKE